MWNLTWRLLIIGCSIAEATSVLVIWIPIRLAAHATGKDEKDILLFAVSALIAVGVWFLVTWVLQFLGMGWLSVRVPYLRLILW